VSALIDPTIGARILEGVLDLVARLIWIVMRMSEVNRAKKVGNYVVRC